MLRLGGRTFVPVLTFRQALPTKPLNQISLSDADNASSLSFVTQKLHDSGVDVKFSQSQIAYIGRLGGRASDLESVRCSFPQPRPVY